MERGGLLHWPSARLVAFDFDGRTRWAREVFRSDAWGRDPGGSKYALAALPDGTACVATDIDVVRVDRDGARAWRRPVDRRGKFANDLCLDRDGAVYVPESGSLTAFSPDGHRLFRVPQALVPLAIDARGRLLARGRAGAGSDRLVALS